MERTKQQGLNALVEKRIQARLASGLTNAKTAVSRLMEEGKIARDFIFEVGTEKKGIKTNIIFKPDPGYGVGSTFMLPEKEAKTGKKIIVPRDYQINMHAVRQVAAKLNIPSTYITSLLMGEEWQQTLAYKILNTHNGWTDRNNVLVRAVGKEVRGFLSDQYRRLDSELIFNAHVEALIECGGQLSDGYMDDTRVMLESFHPKPIEVVTELNGIILLAFGTRIATSDYGDGALELRSFILQGVCLNGMVRESVLRAVHLGAKLSNIQGLSDETYLSDSKTTALAIRDLTKNLYSSDAIKEHKLEIKAAAGVPVGDPVMFLRNLHYTGKLLIGESNKIGEMMMRNDPKMGLQGESTLWKLSQGITAYANEEDVTPRRRMELAEVAGDLLNKIKSN